MPSLNMRLFPFVLAFFIAIPSQASGKANARFAQGAPLPAWSLPLAEIPPTTRTDAVVTRVAETQTLVGPVPADLVHQAVQVNDRSALAVIGQFGIPYLPDYQKLTLHRVLVLRGASRIDVTKTVNVRDLDNEEDIHKGVYGGGKTAQLLIDDVRLGDTLSIVYSISGANPIFGKRWADHFSWDSIRPIELRRLTIIHPKDRVIKWRQVGDFRTGALEPVVEQAGNMVRMRFEGRGIDPVEPEPSIPGDYFPARILQMSEYESWNEVAAWARKLVPPAPPSTPLRELAAKFRSLKGAEQQASAALHWVQDEIRYFSVSIGVNSHRPQPPEAVLKRRYGDCKDKSYLLVSLLEQLGIHAEPVLVNTFSPETPARLLATPKWFDHMIVRVELDGKQFYVDPTRAGEKGLISVLPHASPGAQALVINDAATGLTKIPPSERDEPLLDHSEKVVIQDFAGNATMESRRRFKGEYARAARLTMSGMSMNELRKAALEPFEKTYPGIKLSGNPEVHDAAGGTEVELVSRFDIPTPVRKEDRMYQFQARPRVTEGSLGIPDKIVRAYPLALQRNYRGRYRIRIEWPAQVRLYGQAAGSTIDNRYFKVREEHSRFGNVHDYELDFRIKTGIVAANEVPELQKEAKRLLPFEEFSLRVHEFAITDEKAKTISLRNLETSVASDDIKLFKAYFAEKPPKLESGFLDGLCSSALEVQAASEVHSAAVAVVGAVAAELKKAPGVSGARRCLGRIRFGQGRFAEATAGLEADPPKASDPAWVELVWSRAGTGDLAGAVRDIELRRSEVAKAGAYQVHNSLDSIALHQRAGIPIPAALAEDERSRNPDTWPRPVIQMQTGLLAPADLIVMAETKQGDAREIALNEAWFYVGQYWLAKQENKRAADAFRWFRENGLRTTVQHKVAIAELERLERGDPEFRAGYEAAMSGDFDTARVKYTAAALRGVPAAEYRLGLMEYDAKAYAKAIPWLEKAAAKDVPGAHNILGVMHDEGLGFAVDKEKAVQFFMQAARTGDYHASSNLAWRYHDGSGGLPKDPANAFLHWKRAAELGNPIGQAKIADAYVLGEVVQQDFVLAMYWAGRAADQDSADGLATIATLLAYGYGYERNVPKAIELWGIAAKRGSETAQVQLANAFELGFGVKRSLEQAYRWYELAAAKGNAHARFRQRVLAMSRRPTRAEAEAILAQFNQMASAGNATASYYLGAFYENGWGVPVDAVEAVRHYKAAAALGHRESQLQLGIIFHFGRAGVPTDYEQALSWYCLAIAQKNLIALNNLADMYEKGAGVPQDYPTAIKIYREVARTGESISLASLGQLYEEGRGLPRDVQLAYRFYVLAQLYGDYGIKEAARLAPGMPKEVIAAAAEFVKKWTWKAPLPDERDNAPAGAMPGAK